MQCIYSKNKHINFSLNLFYLLTLLRQLPLAPPARVDNEVEGIRAFGQPMLHSMISLKRDTGPLWRSIFFCECWYYLVFRKTYQQIQKNNTIILISFIIFFTTLVTVINLKKFLTNVDANLCYDSNGPKNIPMFHQVMTIQWRQNCPIFQPPIETLVPTPHPILHHLVLGRIRCAPWTLHFLGCLPNVSIVHLHPYVLIQPMRQATTKILMSGYIPAAYGSLTHMVFPARISTPIFYRNPHFPLNLNKEKGFSGMAGPCCGMRTSVPSTLMRQLFRLPLSVLLSKTILRK